MASFLGIDLGTTFSAAATIDDTGRPVIIHNSDGQNITPSCVAVSREGVLDVGEQARRTWANAPEQAAARFKRDMGTSVEHRVGSEDFTPTQLSSFVLKKLLADAEAAIGPIGEAVVTIPANFAHEAREATMAAARAAGLNVSYIVNEPTAAALYYAFKGGGELRGTYAVYDLGGGTFDISIIKVDGQDVEVVATNGVSKLGGDDFDAALQALVQAEYAAQAGEDLEPDDYTRSDAEDEKKSLSRRESAKARAARKLIEVTREEFEEAISALITQAEMMCESTMDEAGVELSEIRNVFLVGGSTRIPLVQRSVQRVFDQEPVATANVDEVVALGAALYAAYKGDRSALSAVQQTAIERIRVAEATSKCFGTISLTHDEARDTEKLVNNLLIRKGDKIPCSVTESFYTVADGQRAVRCKVAESIAPESDPRFVKVIWEGDLELPPDRPKGQEIRVTFAYDDNQIMKCSFVDSATDRETTIDLSLASSEGADPADVERFLVE